MAVNIGLTGGIATGKSTVSAILVRKGALLIDADLIAREVVLPGTVGLQQVIERFGPGVLQQDGALDRKRLGAIVFQDEPARKALEEIVHPQIRKLIIERLQTLEAMHPDRLVVADIPLLYESRYESLFSEIMVVYVPEQLQLQRLKQRENLSDGQALARLQAQLPIEEKKRRADVLIDNSGTLEHTEHQLERFWTGKGLR